MFTKIAHTYEKRPAESRKHRSQLFRPMKSAITLSQVPEALGGPFVLRSPLPDAFSTAADLGFDAVELFLPVRTSFPSMT